MRALGWRALLLFGLLCASIATLQGADESPAALPQPAVDCTTWVEEAACPLLNATEVRRCALQPAACVKFRMCPDDLTCQLSSFLLPCCSHLVQEGQDWDAVLSCGAPDAPSPILAPIAYGRFLSAACWGARQLRQTDSC